MIDSDLNPLGLSCETCVGAYTPNNANTVQHLTAHLKESHAIPGPKWPNHWPNSYCVSVVTIRFNKYRYTMNEKN